MSNEIPAKVSDVFDPTRWRTVTGFDDFQDMTYHRQVERSADGTVVRDLPTVRIAFDRPEVRNAFRPGTVDELYRAMDHARMTPDVATVLLTGNGPSPKDGGHSFCSGGDQRIRGRDGYRYASGEGAETIDPARAGRLHILEVQRLIRTMPKVVIAVVPVGRGGRGTDEGDIEGAVRLSMRKKLEAITHPAIGEEFLRQVAANARGLTAFGPTLFTQSTPPPGSAGGLANAIYGSVLIVGFATLDAVAPAAGVVLLLGGVAARVYMPLRCSASPASARRARLTSG